jgi:hypothetical protein
MKTFKQFIFESEKPKKEYEIISNSHGAHASIDVFAKNPYHDKPKEYEIISNSHGSHASKPTKLKENTEHPSFEEHFLPKIKSADDRIEFNKGMDDHMDNLHASHPHTSKGKFHLNEFTAGSSGITRDLIRHHTEGVPLEHEHFVHNLDRHGFVPAKHKFDTYSGVGFNIKNAEPAGKSKEGNPVYHQPTYLSSSIDKHVANSFALTPASRNNSKEAHILHWHHNEHDPVGVVGKHSDYPAEKEVLIPRTESTKDKHHIEHLGTDKYNDQFGYTVHVHHVKRIPESQITKD